MTQLLGLITALYLLAFPVRAFLLAASVPLVWKFAWAGLFVLAMAWRSGRAQILLVLTPTIPWLPYEVRGIPNGVFHVMVASLALPWLIDYVTGRVRVSYDPLSRVWALVLLVIACSAVTQYAGFAATFGTPAAFWQELHSELASYIFLRPSGEMANVLVASTTFLDGFLAYLIFRTSPDGSRRFTEVAAAVAIGVAAVGGWQAFTGMGLRSEWQFNDPFITRVNATFSDPNALAAYLALMIPLLLCLAGLSAGSVRWAWLGGTALVSAALVMTAGRIASLAALAGSCVVALGILRFELDRHDRWPAIRRHFRMALGTSVLMLLLALTTLTALGTGLDARHADQRSYIDTWLYTLNLRRPLDETAKGRLAIWKTVGLAIQENPTFGVGAGRLYGLFRSYSRQVPEAPQGMALSAHNTFLQVAAELGLVGLGIWLGFLAMLFATTWLGLSHAASGAEATGTWLSLGILGSLSALVVTMTTGDRTILREDLVLIAMIAALCARSVPAPIPEPRPVWHRLQLAAVAAIAVVLLAALPLRVLSARRGVPLDRVTSGVYGVEYSRDGRPFRWIEGQAVFHLRPETTKLTFRVRRVAPFEQHVRVLIGRTPAVEADLVDHNWQEFRIPLVASPANDYHRVEVTVSPTWSPEDDARELGVMIDWDAQ